MHLIDEKQKRNTKNAFWRALFFTLDPLIMGLATLFFYTYWLFLNIGEITVFASTKIKIVIPVEIKIVIPVEILERQIFLVINRIDLRYVKHVYMANGLRSMVYFCRPFYYNHIKATAKQLLFTTANCHVGKISTE